MKLDTDGLSGHTSRGATDGRLLVVSVLGGAVGGFLLSMSLTLGWSTHFAHEGTWGFVFWDDHVMLRVVGSVLASVGGGLLGGLQSGAYGRWVGGATALPALVGWGVVALEVFSRGWLFQDLHADLPPAAEAVVAGGLIAVVPSGAIGGAWGEWIHMHYRDRVTSPSGFVGLPGRHLVWFPVWFFFFMIQAAWSSVVAWDVVMLSWSGSIMRFPAIILCVVALVILGRALRGVYQIIRDSHAVAVWPQKIPSLLKYGIAFPVAAWIIMVGAMVILMSP